MLFFKGAYCNKKDVPLRTYQARCLFCVMERLNKTLFLA
jgi:hypothetical protein